MVFYKEKKIEEIEDYCFEPFENGITISVNGVQCGYIAYGVVKNHMEIIDVYVNEKFRGKAYAKQLMQYVLSIEGLEEVRLCSNPSFRIGEKVYLDKKELEIFFNNFRFGATGQLKIIQHL